MTPGNEWDADLDLAPGQARDLIAAAFPALRPRQVVPLQAGWDNHVFLVDDAWIFRFPRREIAVRFIASERDLLPALAPRLPQPVPLPEWIGAPSEAFPRPWLGYRRLPGETACRVDPTDAQRAGMAAPLGRFLRALHGIDPGALPAPLPADFIDRAGAARRAVRLAEALETWEHDPGVPLDDLRRVLDEVVATPPFRGPPVPAHGDLYARHLLVDPADPARLAGILDWGDLHVGDPAVDLGIAWTYLPAGAHRAFLDAYGPVDEATWMRARYRAVHYGYHLLRYALAEGDRDLAREARRSFRQAIA